MKSIIVLAWLGVCAAGMMLPVRVRAASDTEYRVAVFDLASGAREPAFARALIERVRAYVQVQPGFLLCEVQGSLEDLGRAAGCDAREPSCMQTLSERLNLDGLIFGTLDEGEHGGPAAVFRRFDAAAGSVVFTASTVFRAPTTKPERLDPEVRRALMELLDNSTTAVALAIAIPRRAVPEPQFIARQAPVLGQAPSGPGLQSVAGYTLLGVAAVSAGMMVVSSLQVLEADDSPEYRRYREAVGERRPDVSDVCTEAEAGRAHGVSTADLSTARQSCENGATFEILQFVFLGGALVTGGLGTYLLLSDDAEEESPATALRVTPRVSSTNFGLRAELTF